MIWDAILSWNFIDKTSQIFGIISVLPIGYSAFVLSRLQKKRMAALKRIKNDPGERPGVLIVDALRKDAGPIRNQVENWIWQRPLFKERQDNVYIALAEFPRDLSSEDMDEMERKVRSAIGKLRTQGVTQYHVFIRGPVVLAAMVGGLLYNSHPAFFYQLGKVGYENWGPIHR